MQVICNVKNNYKKYIINIIICKTVIILLQLYIYENTIIISIKLEVPLYFLNEI